VPKRLLFTCTQNAVRSVIAEALFNQLACAPDYQLASCGVIEGAADGYAITVMQEKGLDISAHEAQSFDALSPEDFDRIISFSAEAHDRAENWAQKGCNTELWEVRPPHIDERARDATLESYRALRDEIATKLEANFGAFVQKT